MARCVIEWLEDPESKSPETYVSTHGCYLGGGFDVFFVFTIFHRYLGKSPILTMQHFSIGLKPRKSRAAVTSRRFCFFSARLNQRRATNFLTATWGLGGIYIFRYFEH